MSTQPDHAMQAIVTRSYGSPDVIELVSVDRPDPRDGEVLVRVHAASINPLDWHFCTGTPYPLRLMAGLRRPKTEIRGVDLAGVIERVGSGVSDVAVGDRVVASAAGAFAEFVATSAENVAVIPDAMSFAEAAALPVAAVTALQGLRDHAEVKPGQRVLINGAAGGVGSYAVQIAKAMGAEVTGVCSTHNVEMVSGLGADTVVDYTTTDFLSLGVEWDAMLDNVGNRSVGECRRALAPDGIQVLVSGPKKGRVLGPIKRMLLGRLGFVGRSQRFASFTAAESRKELRALLDMVERGELRSVIDRHYSLEDAADAMRYIETGHARAKVIIDVVPSAG